MTPDHAFVRRAVELADLDAVRVALYQQTQDIDIAALPRAAVLDEAGRELLVSRAVDWLMVNAGPRSVPEPPETELRALMNMATTEVMGDLEFEARRELPAFKPFPLMTVCDDESPLIPEDFVVAIIGSGFSGLAMAVQLTQLGIPYIVLERRPEPGGTWSVNRYPDIRVDTMSITYEFAFEKEHRWSEYFARGGEVREYLQRVSQKYGTDKHTRYEHDLLAATFDDQRNHWNLEVRTPDGNVTIQANVLVNAVGTFANPNLPTFQGQEQFDGAIVHPSRWPEDLDLTGKRVAIVGNGSTGVQLLASIAEVAEHVTVFQRTPQWIAPRPKYGAPVEPEVLWLLDNFPGYWNWWRYMAIAALFNTHEYLFTDDEWVARGGHVNEVSDKLRADLTAYIHAQTGGRQDLVDRLVPDYAPFARRPVVDNHWYEALTRPNVALVTEHIDGLTATGVETADGTQHPVDIIITATGFEVAKYLWPADYRGVDGASIHQRWSKDGPRAYLGMLVPDYPNMFMLYGPNSQPLSGGTGLPVWYVVWASYVAKCVVRMLQDGKSRVEVRDSAFEQYNHALDKEAASLLLLQEQGAPDKNYYVNEFGRLQVNAPWYGPDYHRMCTIVDWDDLLLS